MDTISLRSKMLELLSKYAPKITSNSARFTSVKDNPAIEITPLYTNWENKTKPAKHDIMGIIDETLFNSMKKGFLFTLDGIYMKEDLSAPCFIPYFGIQNVSITKTKKDDAYSELKIDYYTETPSFTFTTIYLNKTPLKNYLLEIKKLNDAINTSEYKALKKNIKNYLSEEIPKTFPKMEAYYYDSLDDDTAPYIKRFFSCSMGNRTIAVLNMPMRDKSKFCYIITTDELYSYDDWIFGNKFLFNFLKIDHVTSVNDPSTGMIRINIHYEDPKGANEFDDKDYSSAMAFINGECCASFFLEIKKINLEKGEHNLATSNPALIVERFFTGKDLREDMEKLLKEELDSALCKSSKISYWDALSDREKNGLYNKLGISIKNRIIAVVDTSLSGNCSSGFAFTTLGFLDYNRGGNAYRLPYRNVMDNNFDIEQDKFFLNTRKSSVQWESNIPEQKECINLYSINKDYFRIDGLKSLLEKLKLLFNKYDVDFRLEPGIIELGNSGGIAERRAYESASYEYSSKLKKQVQIFEQESQKLKEQLAAGKVDKEKAEVLLDQSFELISELESKEALLKKTIAGLKDTVDKLKTEFEGHV